MHAWSKKFKVEGYVEKENTVVIPGAREWGDILLNYQKLSEIQWHLPQPHDKSSVNCRTAGKKNPKSYATLMSTIWQSRI